MARQLLTPEEFLTHVQKEMDYDKCESFTLYSDLLTHNINEDNLGSIFLNKDGSLQINLYSMYFDYNEHFADCLNDKRNDYFFFEHNDRAVHYTKCAAVIENAGKASIHLTN